MESLQTLDLVLCQVSLLAIGTRGLLLLIIGTYLFKSLKLDAAGRALLPLLHHHLAFNVNLDAYGRTRITSQQLPLRFLILVLKHFEKYVNILLQFLDSLLFVLQLCFCVFLPFLS